MKADQPNHQLVIISAVVFPAQIPVPIPHPLSFLNNPSTADTNPNTSSSPAPLSFTNYFITPSPPSTPLKNYPIATVAVFLITAIGKMSIVKDSRRVESRNVIIYPLEEPVEGSLRLGSTGFFQCTGRARSNENRHLTFKQLYHELGQAFQWISYDPGRHASDHRNAYAGGIVLLAIHSKDSIPNDTTPGKSKTPFMNPPCIIHLTDFSMTIVPIGEYLLVHHNTMNCGNSGAGCSSDTTSHTCDSLRMLSHDRRYRDPETGELPQCIRGVVFDYNQTYQIYDTSPPPPPPVYPCVVIRKRRRTENTGESSGESSAIAGPVTNAVMQTEQPDSSFRTEVSERDLFCRLSGQTNNHGLNEAQSRQAVDACSIVPCGAWTADLSLAVWSVRGNPNLDPHQLYSNDCENGVYLRRDLGQHFAEFLWSVDPV